MIKRSLDEKVSLKDVPKCTRIYAVFKPYCKVISDLQDLRCLSLICLFKTFCYKSENLTHNEITSTTAATTWCLHFSPLRVFLAGVDAGAERHPRNYM